MIINFTDSFIKKLELDYQKIYNYLKKNQYFNYEIPKSHRGINKSGEAYSIAYPIQGLLKYHGLADIKERIAYFPSISLNNGSGFTVSYLKFSPNLKKDIAYLNGKKLKGKKLERIVNLLDVIRKFSKIKTKAIIVSRNFLKILKNKNSIITSSIEGKGLGTSASGGAALATAAISIIYNGRPEFTENKRLISIFSRYLSGSASRSAAGGIAIWLNHPKIDSYDSYAIRLDRDEISSWLNNITLITIPLQSKLKTDQAHKIALKSPFYKSWALNRCNMVFKFIEALNEKNFEKIGELTETDTLALHSVSMTAKLRYHKKFFAWTYDTLKIMSCIEKIPGVYYSIDTGPSVVLLTLINNKNKVIKRIKELNQNFNLSEGKIAGPSKIIDENSFEANLIKEDIEKFVENNKR
ncbi:MAG: diphosphomevalonate/mevalonate 3,5-bisphosphate decarboxylase family protein [Candidatus Helarchaeota archaeon]